MHAHAHHHLWLVAALSLGVAIVCLAYVVWESRRDRRQNRR